MTIQIDGDGDMETRVVAGRIMRTEVNVARRLICIHTYIYIYIRNPFMNQINRLTIVA
mgnify:CR=1 FL=1